MTMLKVLILEGHRGVRDALARRLCRLQGIQVIGEVGTIADAQAMITEQRPDVLLCDPRTVGDSPVEVIHGLRAAGPEVVVLTTSLLDSDASDWLRAGAAAVLLKGCSMHAIYVALQAAAKEHTLVPNGAFALLGFGNFGMAAGGHAFTK